MGAGNLHQPIIVNEHVNIILTVHSQYWVGGGYLPPSNNSPILAENFHG